MAQYEKVQELQESMAFRSTASLGNPLLNKYSSLTHALIKMTYCSHLLVGG